MMFLVNLVWLPLLALLGMMFPAEADVYPQTESLRAQAQAQSAVQAWYDVPPIDSPFYGDLPGTRPREKTVWPELDWERLSQEYAELDEQNIGEWFELLGDQLIDQDFQVILLNYPRVAIVYDGETGEVKGITDEGVFHLGFSYNVKESLFYATRNPWMRVMGYNEFYDWLGDDVLGMFDLITRRVRFTYDGLDYQVQLWKGKYFFSTCMGSEVGFYTKPTSRAAQHYDCFPLEDMMPISMKLYNERDVYFDLPPEDHWWSVMMAHRLPRLSPHQVTLESGIDFTKDPGLGEAFYAALEEECPDFEMEKDGDLVWFRWNATEGVEP